MKERKKRRIGYRRMERKGKAIGKKIMGRMEVEKEGEARKKRV